jgi:TonB-linked SusC/RagA family outer membrane protein
MKLSIVLVLLAVLEVKAGAYAQGSITLNMQQVEIQKVLNRIEKQGEFRFLYNYDLESLKKKVDVNFQQSGIKDALDKLLVNTDLTYKILENNLVVVMSSTLEKQDIRITGKITGANGEALSGVSVLVKGSSVGTNTDNNGNFTLTVPEEATLIISYIGYETKEIKVNKQSVVNIQISPSTKQLDQIVVIGYGALRQKDITSAISTVDVKDISTRPIVSADEALAGKSPGVQVVQPSGKPGSALEVRVRGTASPLGGQPLYVIDGVMADDASGIDPNNIESISILKDASAAGIYGTAGGSNNSATNGVVLITTKQGTKGKTRVDVNTYTGIQQIVKKLPMLNGQQLITLLDEEEINAGQPPLAIPPALQSVNNNWQDIVYRKSPMTGISAGFSGGSDKGTFRLSLGYLNQDGIVKLSNYTRYSLNLNLEQNLNNWLSVGAHANYNRTNSRDVPDNSRVNQGGVVLGALSTPPFVPKYNADGTFGLNPFQAWENPLASIEGPYNKTIGNSLLGDAHLQVKLPFNLRYRTQFGVSLNNSNYDYFLDPYRTQYGRSKNGIGQNNTQEIFRYSFQNTLTFDKSFGNHSINAVAGMESIEQKETYGYMYGESFQNANVMTLNEATSNKSISTSKQEWSLISYFARVNYSYNDRYLLTASIRSDGSSRLGTDNQFGYFPAFSAGWRVSREDFMQNIKAIDDLKLRAGWGETGNIPFIGSYYPSTSTVSGGNNYPFGPIFPGVVPSSTKGNPDLKWEETKQFNIGFDLSMFNRIRLTADYYNKRTTGLIYQQNLPFSTGYSYILANVVGGVVQNNGFEFNLAGDIFKGKDFTWTSSLNMSFNKNIMKGLDSNNIIYSGGIPERDNSTITKNGLPIGAFWGYISNGVDPQTGYIKYRQASTGKDVFGGALNPGKDRTYLGSALPKFTFGFINDFAYKNFTLSVLIDGVYGNKVFDATRIETEGMFQVNNSSTAALRRWKSPGDHTDIPQARFADSAQNTLISSRFIEDGSFLRVKNISLAYNLHNSWIKSLGVSNLRFYVSLQNIATISNYKGYQPEVNRDGQSPLSQGIDYGTYPQAKTVTFGINLQL